MALTQTKKESREARTERKNNMDKINDVFISVTTVFFAGCAWVIKRLFNRIDDAHRRIDKLDSLVDRAYLENQLKPIRGEVSLILQTLLENSKRN